MSLLNDFQVPQSRAECVELDRIDPFSEHRHRFELEEGLIYLDGNSLGPLPTGVGERIQSVVHDEWGRGLIRSWNQSDWYSAPRRIGGKLSQILGCPADDVVVTDSVSVNLFKLLVAGLRLRTDRRVILTDESSFPTDLYIAESVADLFADVSVLRVAPEDLESAIDDQVSVLLLSHVDYKSGYLYDMRSINERAIQNGVVTLWDLSHTAGALPIDLQSHRTDMAVGCGYKYLNGGPGAPSFAYVRSELQDQIQQPLSGWFGHRDPFEFAAEFRPAPDVGRLLCGTPPMLSMLALEASLSAFEDVSLADLRRKSLQLSETMIGLVETQCPQDELQLLTPRAPENRGSHVSFGNPNGYAIVQALIDQNIIGDFRDPDLMRFGICPLYLKFQDIWDFVSAFSEVIRTRSWDRPQFTTRKAVT